MTIWLTSDEHHGHANIIRLCNRPFENVHHMTEEIVRRHNMLVHDDDLVIHVGDFSLDEKRVPRVLPRLRGRHKLVVGNHDKAHSCHKKWESAVERYVGYGFEEVVDQLSVNNGGIEFLVCHLPYSGDHSDTDRFSQWRPKDDGRWLIHGHVHNAWGIRDRMINVGVDVWAFEPVQIEVLAELATSKGMPKA